MEWNRMTMAQNALQYNIVKQNGIEQMGQIEEQKMSKKQVQLHVDLN